MSASIRWNDPALGLSIFYGTQLAPFYALPEIRQELVGSAMPDPCQSTDTLSPLSR